MGKTRKTIIITRFVLNDFSRVRKTKLRKHRICRFYKCNCNTPSFQDSSTQFVGLEISIIRVIHHLLHCMLSAMKILSIEVKVWTG